MTGLLADERNSLRGFRHAAVRLRPAGRVVDEFLHLSQHLRLELSARPGDSQHVLPGGEGVQRDAEVAEDFLGLRINVVKENHEAVVALAARFAQRVDEVDLALAVGGEIFHQQDALAWNQLAVDLRAAAEAFRLLAHVLHRQVKAVGNPGRERNAGRLAARYGIDLVAADIALDGVNRKIHQGRADIRKRHQPARVVVNRAGPAAREDERLVAHEAYRARIEIHSRGQLGDGFWVKKLAGHRLTHNLLQR